MFSMILNSIAAPDGEKKPSDVKRALGPSDKDAIALKVALRAVDRKLAVCTADRFFDVKIDKIGRKN